MNQIQTHQSLPEHNVTSGAVRPGEYIHYYANMLTLFRSTRSLDQIDAMARDAVSLRERRIDQFGNRLETMRNFFGTTHGTRRMTTHLCGWDVERLQRLRRDYGGLLLAIFHFGEHRHVLSDLCCLGIPFVAPIAKRSYFDATSVLANGPEDCIAAPQMLEVENRSVGRHLLMALKRGRIGLIYVDGNMGPDGHLVEESGVEVDFLGHRIRVKSGIARLAMAMHLPVLPMLAVPDRDSPAAAHRLLAMPEIPPVDKARADASQDTVTRRIMQTCYDALATVVAEFPQHWEFGFCLHRWLRVNATVATAQSPSRDALVDTQVITLDQSTVIAYPRKDGVYWIHVGRQRAYRLPDWSDELYDLMRQGPHSLHELTSHLQIRANGASDAAALLQQLHALELIQPLPRIAAT